MPAKNVGTLAAEGVAAQLAARGIVEVDRWENWRRGDVCGIVGEAGVFTFMSVRVDQDGEAMHANVVGGPVFGQQQTKEWRAFSVDRLSTTIRSKGRKIKAADEGEDNGEDG